MTAADFFNQFRINLLWRVGQLQPPASRPDWLRDWDQFIQRWTAEINECTSTEELITWVLTRTGNPLEELVLQMYMAACPTVGRNGLNERFCNQLRDTIRTPLVLVSPKD